MQNADDILLISPTRNAFELEEFAKDSNITFSLDTVLFKSKRKCLYLVGSRKKQEKPLFQIQFLPRELFRRQDIISFFLAANAAL